MKKRLSLLALCSLAGPLAAQQADSTIVPLDAIVAVVGTTPVTVNDVKLRLADSARAIQARNQPMPNEEARRAMAVAVLNGIVDEEVLLAKAKEMSIEVSDAEITSAVDQQIKEISSRFPSDAVFRQQLQSAGLGTPEEYRRYMTTQFKRDKTIQMLVQKLMAPGENQIPQVTVPEAKVQEEFERLKTGGLPPRQASVLWRQMVIAPRASAAAKAVARAKADSLLAQIRAGGDFERIAKRESMDAATKDLGGDLGWRKRGDLPEELERLVFGPFAIRPGDVSGVVESPFGFHIIRLDRANPPNEVKVRQILIVPKVDSADVVRAQKLADSLTTALRHGAIFDSVARHYHDLAEDAPGLMSETPYDSLPASYQAGLRGVKKDSIVDFPIPAGPGILKYVIAQVVSASEGGQYSYDQVKERLRANLQQVAQMRRYIDSQRKQLYVKVFEDRVYAATSVFDRAGSP